MSYFPLVDPIPLPAPVWLFKALHVLTLALHFIAVKILLGGLLIASVLNFFGASHSLRKGAAGALARRLPIVMTYVINLGVPPLLFSQVLYGQALYTSSVLIGAYWIAVVFLLMACYWLLYGFADGASAGRSVWWKGLLAWVLACVISRIFSTNMTLMLTPEVWNEMYSATASGIYLPPFDATLNSRWLFMLAGGFWVSGLWMIWIAGRKTTEPSLGRYLSGLGGKLAVVMVLVQASQFFFLLQAQPAAVKEGIASNTLLKIVEFGWCVAAVLVLLFGVWVSNKKPCNYLSGYVALALVFFSVSSWTILRDGIRDITLTSKGFVLWEQAVMTNWGVVGWFLLAFGIGIAALVWLISVMMQAKPVAEGGL